MTHSRSTHLLQSKLQPPRIAASWVQRHTLLQRLATIDTRVVLLEAPAGYGKTTAMAQWYAQLTAAGRKAAWLTLDAYDDDSTALLEYLAALFVKAELIDEPASDLALVRSALDALLEAASHAPHGAVLFLDDLHTLSAPACLELVRMLLADSRDNVRVVLATRGRHLDIAKLLLQEQVCVLTECDIRFEHSEMEALLGRSCTPELLAVLDHRTRGWPVALKSLQTAMRRNDGDLPQLANCIVDVAGVVEYLAEQVMRPLSDDLQRLLIATNITSHLTGELVNQLCGRTDGWTQLDTLVRRCLFIARTADGDSYRYHDFFREFLRRQLRFRTDLDAAALHRQAAQYFLAASQFEDALKHSIEAADWDMAIRIVEDEGSWHLGVQRGADALRRVQTIPAEFVQRSLGARLAVIYVLLHYSQADTAREQLDALRQESLDFTVWRGAPVEPSLGTDCRALEAILVLCEDQPLAIEFVERIKREARAQGTRGQFVRVLAEYSLSIYVHYAAGRYRECGRLGEEGLVPLEQISAHFGLGYLYIYLGMSQLALGRAQLAHSWYGRALDLATRRFPNEGQRLEVLACVAETQYHQGDLDAARMHISAVLAGLKAQDEIDGTVFQCACLTAASLHARSGDLDAALAALLEARAIAGYMQREQRVALIDIHRVEELTRAGRYADAEQILQQDDFQLVLSDLQAAPVLSMRAALALARYQLLTGHAHAARATLSLLDQKHENELIKLKGLLLLAAAQFAMDDRAASMESLRALCSRVIPTGLKQLVIDERPLIQPLLDHLLEHEPMGTSARANAERLMEDWLGKAHDLRQSSPPIYRAVTPTFVEPEILSPRQREVLELLAAGLSGKEIASRLSLSESTVKSYRKVLYVKLSAGRRSQALANARRMLLLS